MGELVKLSTGDCPTRFPSTRLSSPGSIDEVYKTCMRPLVLVLCSSWSFLQNWRATWCRPPRCRDHQSALHRHGGNGLHREYGDLFALILAIGIVVDDAIVIVEGASME